MSKSRDVLVCPRCSEELFRIDQKTKDGQIVWEIVKCLRCKWAISLDHHMVDKLIQEL